MAQEMRNLNDHIAYLFVQTSHDVASALDWEAVFRRPDHATLCERRGEPEKAERARAWFRGVA